MKVRNWLLGLLLIAGFAVLVGCGSAEEEETPAAPAPAPAAPAPAAPAPAPAAPAPAASAAPAPAASAAKRGGIINYAMPEIPTLDPFASGSTQAGNLIGQNSDVLIFRNPITYEFEPGGLLTSWKLSADGLTWTFNLKEGVKFHNGDPFNAEAMAASFTYGHAEGVVPPIYLPQQPAMVALDEHTFQITADKVYGPMLDHLSWAAWFAVTNEKHRQAIGADEYGRDPVGTGPFKFKKWVAGASVEFERYEDYAWAPDFFDNRSAAYLDGFKVVFLQELATVAAALQAGQVDVAYAPNPFTARLRRDDQFVVHTVASGRLRSINPNISRKPFDDVNVRRALQHAFDREKFVQSMENGEGVAQYCVLVQPLPFYSAVIEQECAEKLDYNPDKALAMLGKAGWTLDANGIVQKDGVAMELDMIHQGRTDSVQFASLVQGQLKELGIKVNLESLERAAFSPRRNSGDWDMSRGGYGTLTADIVLYQWHPEQGKGYNRSFVPDDAPLWGQTVTVMDACRHNSGDQRAKKCEDMVRWVSDQAITIPILNPNQNTVVNKRVNGFIVHRNSMDWFARDAWLEE